MTAPFQIAPCSSPYRWLERTEPGNVSSSELEANESRREHLLLWYSFALFATSGLFFVVHRSLKYNHQHTSQKYIHASDVAAWGSLWFAFSVTMVVYNNWLLNYWQGGFHFPITISMIHMWIKLFVSYAIVKFKICSNRARTSTAKVHIPRSVWWFNAVPVGVTTALDIGSSNLSLLFISIPFYTVVKSSSLVFVLLFSVLYRLQYFRWSLLFVTLLICLGVLMASFGEPHYSSLGFALAMSSAALGGLRWSLTERLMHGVGVKMNSIMTIFTISPAAAVVLIPFALLLEGNLYRTSKFFNQFDLFILAMINTVGAGLFAFAMIFVELALLHRTSSMTLSVIGYLKQIFQIIVSVIIFEDNFTALNGLGLLVTLVGMFIYNRIKLNEMEEENSKRLNRGHSFLELEDTFEENFEGLTFVVNSLEENNQRGARGAAKNTIGSSATVRDSYGVEMSDMSVI